MARTRSVSVTIRDGNKLWRISKTKFVPMLLRLLNGQPALLDVAGTELGEADFDLAELTKDKIPALLQAFSDDAFTAVAPAAPAAPLPPPTDTVVSS